MSNTLELVNCLIVRDWCDGEHKWLDFTYICIAKSPQLCKKWSAIDIRENCLQ